MSGLNDATATGILSAKRRFQWNVEFFRSFNRCHLRALDVSQPLGLVDWGKAYLPNHFRAPPSLMHLWLAEQFDAMTHQRGMKLNIIGPRGGAKSTLATLAGVLRAATLGHEPYIWIIGDTRHQAY